jgi:hypothetical protein
VSRPAVESRGSETRASAGTVSARCRRPACGLDFIPRRAGRAPAFCSAACRRAFDSEARRAGQRKLLASRRAAAYHAPSFLATGRGCRDRQVPPRLRQGTDQIAHEMRRSASSHMAPPPR